jgi:uncharacterized protein
MRPEEFMPVKKKFSNLLSSLRNTDAAVIAFSGGADSSFLLYTMKMAEMRILAVTSVSETTPKRDLQSSLSFAKEMGVEHVTVRTDELSNEDFVRNAQDRCFHCKDELFKKMRSIAAENNVRSIFDGTNADDLNDYRPGIRAAVLHGIRSPLAEFNFSKEDIRIMSRELGLSTWDKPSSPCLSSRVPYGQEISLPALRRIEEAEEFIRTFGIRDVRVRDHGDMARIEVGDEDMHIIYKPENRSLIVEALKSFGYRFVSLDLEGYRSGSMNRVLGHANCRLKI